MSGGGVFLIIGMGLMLIYDGYCLASREDDSSRLLVQKGVASWYGQEEQGELTADGEHFDRHKFTAASRHLPFNTIVRVTNQDNGRSVQVRINDRGPFARSRVLDLSEAAADSLDMKKTGTAPVKIEVVAPASAEASDAP
jgi:rare lipoprotein A